MSIFSYFRKHAVISIVVVVAAVIIGVIGGRAASQKPAVANDSGVKQVTLANVAQFRKGNTSVSVNGVVESHSQADLKSQTSAPVSVINVDIGQSVYPGQVLLELQNDDIRAQLAQAQANLASVQGQSSTGAVSLDSAKQSAIEKIKDAYTKTYQAVIGQAEPILYNNDGNRRDFYSYSPDFAVNSEISQAYLSLKTAFPDWKRMIDTLDNSTSTANVIAAAQISQRNMSTADAIFAGMSKILNNLGSYATPAFSVTVNGWKATVSGAQSSVTGAEQALTGAYSALTTTVSTQTTTVPAQVSAAQAGVSNLQAQLAKTIIRSPIAGKVSALPLREGELAAPGTLVATVIGNDSGLEIKSYASGDDIARIRVGATVSISNQVSQSASSTIKGIVSNVAPSVDAITKKAEVDIEVADGPHSGLVIGQNVTALVSTSATASSVTPGQTVTYLLPIQDVKIIPGSAYVYTVSSDSKIVRNEVTLGDVNGDFIEVKDGLTDDMNIVSPVYELDEGQTVNAQQ